MRIIQYISLLFFFLLPFHALAVTYINSLFFDFTSNIPFFISGWKEIILAFFFLNSAIWLFHHFRETRKQFDYVDVFLVLFSIVGLLVGIMNFDSNTGLMQTVLGIKYDFFFIWLLFFFKHLPVFSDINISQNFLEKLRNTILFSGIFVIAFAYLQYFSDANFLIKFGYFDAPSVDTIEKPASFCQLLENTNECRIQSTFAGPIRFAGFLVFLTGLLASIFLQKKHVFQEENNFTKNYPKIKILVNLFLYILYFSILSIILFILYKTYSRGAWIAEIIVLLSSFILYFQINIKKFFTYLAYLFAGLFIIFALFFSYKTYSNYSKISENTNNSQEQISVSSAINITFNKIQTDTNNSPYFQKIKNIFVRNGSTGKHIEGITKSIEIIKTHPEGQGLGTAGPASTLQGVENQMLNENWYLQIFTELGVVGGIIFLLFSITILLHLKKEKSEYFPVILALFLMALFTHLWEESALAYSVFALLGIELEKYKNV